MQKPIIFNWKENCGKTSSLKCKQKKLDVLLLFVQSRKPSGESGVTAFDQQDSNDRDFSHDGSSCCLMQFPNVHIFIYGTVSEFQVVRRKAI